jgi:uncharacterized protein (DUF305 family)
MIKQSMFSNKFLTTFTIGSIAALLTINVSACTKASTPTSSGSSTSSETSQNSMPGMNHGDMKMNQSPSSSMSGMNHGSMNMTMDLGPKDTTFDLRFIDGMIPHHEGAVVMAREALQKSKRPEIQKLAQSIIIAQDKEIGQMKDWRKAWYSTVPDTPMMYDTSMGHMMPMSDQMRNSMMMSGDLGAADDQFDLRFLNAMIPHHQGAIDMANQAIEKSNRSEIKQLSQDILSSQQKEIDQMTQWRKDWYSQ